MEWGAKRCAGKSRPPSSPQEPIVPLNHIISNHIKTVLEKTKGKINGLGGAAEILEIHPSMLRHKMDKLDIEYGRKT